MNKGEFIDYMAKRHECTKSEAKRIINAFRDAVALAFSEDKEIKLIGFGKFYSKKVATKKGTNPKTGQIIEIKAYVQPKFKASSKLKEACNGKKLGSKQSK